MPVIEQSGAGAGLAERALTLGMQGKQAASAQRSQERMQKESIAAQQQQNDKTMAANQLLARRQLQATQQTQSREFKFKAQQSRENRGFQSAQAQADREFQKKLTEQNQTFQKDLNLTNQKFQESLMAKKNTLAMQLADHADKLQRNLSATNYVRDLAKTAVVLGASLRDQEAARRVGSEMAKQKLLVTQQLSKVNEIAAGGTQGVQSDLSNLANGELFEATEPGQAVTLAVAPEYQGAVVGVSNGNYAKFDSLSDTEKLGIIKGLEQAKEMVVSAKTATITAGAQRIREKTKRDDSFLTNLGYSLFGENWENDETPEQVMTKLVDTRIMLFGDLQRRLRSRVGNLTMPSEQKALLDAATSTQGVTTQAGLENLRSVVTLLNQTASAHNIDLKSLGVQNVMKQAGMPPP